MISYHLSLHHEHRDMYTRVHDLCLFRPPFLEALILTSFSLIHHTLEKKVLRAVVNIGNQK